MPIHSRASIRYARALLIAAEKASTLSTMREEVEALRGLVAGSPELRVFLEDPTIAKQDKRSILKRLFGAKLSPLLWRFLEMLTNKYRERMLPDILDAVVTELDKREGRVVAEVRSAVPLSDTQQESLRKQIERITGLQVEIRAETDDSLITGFVARVGDTVFDASLSAQLARLRDRLSRADLRAAANVG